MDLEVDELDYNAFVYTTFKDFVYKVGALMLFQQTAGSCYTRASCKKVIY